MSNYELYEKVLSSLHEDEGTFNAAARNWIEGADDAPFESDEAKNLFYEAKLADAAWRSKAIYGRISKVRMINSVREIAEKNFPNPYEKPVEETKSEPEDQQKYVFGVVDNVKIENKIAEEIPNVVEEPKEEKHFFGKRKNR